MQCYAAKQARLCAVSQHFSPPEEQTVCATWLWGHVQMGAELGNHKKWEGKRDGALVMKYHYIVLYCSAAGVSV